MDPVQNRFRSGADGLQVSGRPDGQPLLFAHGFGCDQNMWRFVGPRFEDEFRVILFDHVGAGRSDLSAYDPAGPLPDVDPQQGEHTVAKGRASVRSHRDPLTLLLGRQVEGTHRPQRPRPRSGVSRRRASAPWSPTT